jgi:hypothetical protein
MEIIQCQILPPQTVYSNTLLEGIKSVIVKEENNAQAINIT